MEFGATQHMDTYLKYHVNKTILEVDVEVEVSVSNAEGCVTGSFSFTVGIPPEINEER